ncbi:SPFH domain-containing protein [Nocardia bhagyanarayanae]|uniref:Regulator of protease activity HflC (Stomatin/prohibitin superfamily) n=1 Tax=Nocardia bhagyanarayanae TaxID=1215925 RepID=A0A543EXD0_9NOCA|nr:SPFH domain-containing protein [Nocardia bhagyanarayanae]TQM26159.1 regulator of protease activity HflC (stomatin/prohibitin superfamily) [Nocardia bhagyanarayanae]
MGSNPVKNTYLDQVVAQQAALEDDLRTRKPAAVGAPAPSAPGAPPQPRSPLAKRSARVGPSAQGQGTGPVEVRVTGFWRWRTVLVPPNAFVVHTRRGRAEPLHIGLGVSFRYPATDSYLVVPGAMQTILINAYCICRELQGVLVQGYVQWIIEDFGTAYRKLDFSDADDPMRLVNIQLREQAEAAIKDKVSTMGVRDVLSDKQPIIEELTARLRAVAEGSGDEQTGGGDRGLGLRIVTVQIKEAVVSSSTLWENLQKPYRTEQTQVARLAELTAQEAISAREAAAQRAGEERRIENERELAQLRDRNEAARFDRETAERMRRTTREHDDQRAVAELAQQTALHTVRLEREQHAEQLENLRLRQELRRMEVDGELALATARQRAEHEGELLVVQRERERVATANAQNDANIQATLVANLPEIVAKLPAPAELRSYQIGGDLSGLATVVAQLNGVIDAWSARRAAGDAPVD